MNYVTISKWYYMISIWMMFLLSKEDCLTPLFKLVYFMTSSSTLLKECRTLEKVVCIFKFYLRETLPLSEIVRSQWKTYHICSKIYGRHGALKRNAVHISGSCFTVMMNFIKAMLPSLCLYNLSWYCVKQKNTLFLEENSMLILIKRSISL